MKAPLTLTSVIGKVAALAAFLPLLAVIYPETVAVAYAAQTSGENALVFQVNSKQKAETQNDVIAFSGPQLTYEQIVQNDPLVQKVRAYLESKGSPLAIYAEEIVKQPQWQRALAISYVESNFGKRCHSNNCSGIGVSPSHPSWRTYATKLDWFKDMSALLEKPIYKHKYTNCNSMRGVYVVPGSDRWVWGCNQVSNELLAITAEAQAERIALAEQSASNTVVATLPALQNNLVTVLPIVK
ncbi:MAG: hypothetical protein R3B41_02180 [Candidatus Doudnabacteria bacterium]